MYQERPFQWAHRQGGPGIWDWMELRKTALMRRDRPSIPIPAAPPVPGAPAAANLGAAAAWLGADSDLDLNTDLGTPDVPDLEAGIIDGSHRDVVSHPLVQHAGQTPSQQTQQTQDYPPWLVDAFLRQEEAVSSAERYLCDPSVYQRAAEESIPAQSHSTVSRTEPSRQDTNKVYQ